MVKCDMLLNNLFESFNKYILKAMEKPILTQMETIRTKLMQRLAMKSVATEKYLGPLCPKIQQKLDNIKLSQVNVGLNMLVGASTKLIVVQQFSMWLIFNCICVHERNGI